ncbi:hypothetical protein ARMGADRAFT_78912 [Armillaria gallica]|uniref:Uncharacterized protein n=1 Tax=Armillaria gallica TaxID=47427 RepID=A0A2H3CBD0_ARMGA|nr:hypothetical protein ARMGADRAFT_78912 [Armillaria gallica]
MCTPGTVQVKIAKEELDERFPLPKPAGARSTSSTMNHSGHLMVVSERESTARPADFCPVLAQSRLSQWIRLAPCISRVTNSSTLPILTASHHFILIDSEDDDDLFFKMNLRKEFDPSLPRAGRSGRSRCLKVGDGVGIAYSVRYSEVVIKTVGFAPDSCIQSYRYSSFRLVQLHYISSFLAWTSSIQLVQEHSCLSGDHPRFSCCFPYSV